MTVSAMLGRWVLAAATLINLTSTTHGQDLDTYRRAMGDLARSSGVGSPDFLVGIGQFYCFMKVGLGEPVRPGQILAALHRRHPDTQPGSPRAGRAQRQAVTMAALILCPD